MKISAKKSGVWATTCNLRDELRDACLVDGVPIPVANEERRLGAFLSYTRRKTASRVDRTAAESQETVRRIEGLKLFLEARATLVSSLVLPKALYGCACSAPSKKALRTLRASCSRAVWGQANRWRANEALHCLFTKGHICDPVQAYAYQCFVTARRVLTRKPELITIFAETLNYRQEVATFKQTPGPVGSLVLAADIANVTFESATQLAIREEKDPMEVGTHAWLACDRGRFEHMLRESLRTEQWNVLSYRRPLFQGAHNGVDRKATLELYKQLSGLAKYKLRCILAGALATRARQHKMNNETTPDCPHCPGIREDAEHIFSECPKYAHLRTIDLGHEVWQAMPNCLKFQGVVPLLDIEGLPPDFCGEVGRKVLGCTVQHNLLDIWDERLKFVDVVPPAPRWGN